MMFLVSALLAPKFRQDELERRGSVLGLGDLVTDVRERLAHAEAHRRFVVNDQDVEHGLSPR